MCSTTVRATRTTMCVAWWLFNFNSLTIFNYFTCKIEQRHPPQAEDAAVRLSAPLAPDFQGQSDKKE